MTGWGGPSDATAVRSETPRAPPAMAAGGERTQRATPTRRGPITYPKTRTLRADGWMTLKKKGGATPWAAR
jgi:hypothetical protein